MSKNIEAKKVVVSEIEEKIEKAQSIVTVTLTAVFSTLALRGTISGTEFLTIFTVVIGFYFGTAKEVGK